MRVDQVDIARDLTAARKFSQRLPVTEFRQTRGMARPPDLPKFDTIGGRVKWWRIRRGIKPKEFAKLTQQSYTALTDLESGRSKDSERLDLIALHLKVNPVYLRTDKGDPEAPAPAVAELAEWPLDNALLGQLRDLDEIEQSYLAKKITEALLTIENARGRRSQKRG